jgi:hypothetical protein
MKYFWMGEKYPVLGLIFSPFCDNNIFKSKWIDDLSEDQKDCLFDFIDKCVPNNGSENNEEEIFINIHGQLEKAGSKIKDINDRLMFMKDFGKNYASTRSVSAFENYEVEQKRYFKNSMKPDFRKLLYRIMREQVDNRCEYSKQIALLSAEIAKVKNGSEALKDAKEVFNYIQKKWQRHEKNWKKLPKEAIQGEPEHKKIELANFEGLIRIIAREKNYLDRVLAE